MTHVVALDVSKGKSMMVVYNQSKQCKFEGEILHNRSSFEELDGILRDCFRGNRVVLEGA